MRKRPLTERLWSRVIKTETCWIWQGSGLPFGYGVIGAGGRGGRSELTHRVAWRLAAGPIPDGQMVLHTCDVPACIRNDDKGTYEINGVLYPRHGHLWLGSHADNAQDKAAKGHAPFGDQHHLRRHPEWAARGEQIAQSILKAPQVLDIRARVAAGEYQSVLAKEYGVSRALVCNIVNRKHWRHI